MKKILVLCLTWALASAFPNGDDSQTQVGKYGGNILNKKKLKLYDF